jgi:hypothetical protein
VTPKRCASEGVLLSAAGKHDNQASTLGGPCVASARLFLRSVVTRCPSVRTFAAQAPARAIATGAIARHHMYATRYATKLIACEAYFRRDIRHVLVIGAASAYYPFRIILITHLKAVNFFE